LRKKNKILIFGINSFVGNNLYNYLKNKHIVTIKKYSKENLKFVNNYDYIINCSINKNYLKKKYSTENDFDLKILNNLKNSNTKYIFLSTRKIYKPKSNITEKSKIECRNHYEKNKFITENKILKVRPNSSIILRISNLIGYRIKNSNRVHKTYLDYFLEQISSNILIDNKKNFKDFLDITTFVKIIDDIIRKKIIGIYNISIGKKIFLNEINNWLLFHYKNKSQLNRTKLPKFYNQKSFFLNNNKIKKKLNIKISDINLKKECIKLSKQIFLSKL